MFHSYGEIWEGTKCLFPPNSVRNVTYFLTYTMDGLHGIFSPDMVTRTEVQNMINNAGFATQSYVTSRGYVTSSTVSNMISNAVSSSGGLSSVTSFTLTKSSSSKSISYSRSAIYLILGVFYEPSSFSSPYYPRASNAAILIPNPYKSTQYDGVIYLTTILSSDNTYMAVSGYPGSMSIDAINIEDCTLKVEIFRIK